MSDDACGRAGARLVAAPQGVEATLTTFAENARHLLPGFDEVSISTIDDAGHVRSHAATAGFVWTLDRLQLNLDEGPYMESLRGAPLVVAPHIERDHRWPRYVRRAAERGLRAQLSASLVEGTGRTLGGLNIYSTTREEIDPAAGMIARVFASQIALSLGHARETERLRAALVTRRTVGQALGLLMAAHQLTEEAAQKVLVRRSVQADVELHDLAAEMVQDANWTGFSGPSAANQV